MLTPRIMTGLVLMVALMVSHLFAYNKGKQVERVDWQQKQIEAMALKNKYEQEAQRLGTELAEYKTKTNRKTSEVQREIPKHTTGKPVYNVDTIRLLHSAIGIPELSKATSEPTGAPEAFATDTDIANWITEAAGQCNSQAEQLNKLIDFYEKTP